MHAAYGQGLQADGAKDQVDSSNRNKWECHPALCTETLCYMDSGTSFERGWMQCCQKKLISQQFTHCKEPEVSLHA